MIEYPSIINSSKAPRKQCIAFDKIDGSNLRFKYTKKRGFDTFGSRTQLIDINTPVFGAGVKYFLEKQSSSLEKYFDKYWPNEREIIVFGEFYGPNSFAGIHDPVDDHRVVIFDVLIGHKDRRFFKPGELIKELGDIVELPKVVYSGNLNDEFIRDVRENKYDLNEGVICKGTETSGAFRGKMWQCKIKTNDYLRRVYETFGDEGLKKYGE